MGFISYFKTYISEFLDDVENRTATNEELHCARILVKMLDDIADEGYTDTSAYIEEGTKGVSRLKALLNKYNVLPFPMVHFTVASNPTYSGKKFELNAYLDKIYNISKAEVAVEGAMHPFYVELHSYTDYLMKEADTLDTACLFLLRDTLFPYLSFRKSGFNNLYAYPIGRKFLDLYPNVTEPERNYEGSTYDHIHDALFGAMEERPKSFTQYIESFRTRLIPIFEAHPGLKTALSGLLAKIPGKRILVIESGYVGTIPSLLAAVDDRVDLRMFASVPFMYPVYRGKLYSDKFEQIRMFETIQSQDALFRVSSYRDEKFYVEETDNIDVLETSKRELMTW